MPLAASGEEAIVMANGDWAGRAACLQQRQAAPETGW